LTVSAVGPRLQRLRYQAKGLKCCCCHSVTDQLVHDSSKYWIGLEGRSDRIPRRRVLELKEDAWVQSSRRRDRSDPLARIIWVPRPSLEEVGDVPRVWVVERCLHRSAQRVNSGDNWIIADAC
jgi:hypothetical protein